MRGSVDEALRLALSLDTDRARLGLLNFTCNTKPDFRVNWHHRVICQAINAMFRGITPRELLTKFGHSDEEIQYMLEYPHPVTKLYAGCTRPEMIDKPIEALQVHMAPRHGKTEIVGRRMPAWRLGENPDTQIIATAYGSELASMANRDVQRIIDTVEYKAIYPHTRLNDSNVRSVATGSYLRNSDIFEIVGKRGNYRSAGVNGTITGLGANLAIIDDPFKNRKQAESPVERLNVQRWYSSTMFTRLEDWAYQVIINTRWHEADLSGVTIKKAMVDATATQWFCLVFPALLDCEPGPGDFRQQGEALWPGKYNVQRLTRIKSTISAYDWDALYQQRPSPGEGGVVKSSWWQFYEHIPTDLDATIISADLTFGNRGDYAVFQVWGVKGAMRFLLEERRERMGFTEQLTTAKSLHQRYPTANAFLVENAANGAAIIDVLNDRIPAMVPISPMGSKNLRLDAVAPAIQAGNVVLPSPTLAPWIEEWVEEFKSFPNGAHDDRVDACSQALDYIRCHMGSLDALLFPELEKESDWNVGLDTDSD